MIQPDRNADRHRTPAETTPEAEAERAPASPDRDGAHATQAHGSFGNGVVGAALAGEAVSGVGPVLRRQVMMSAAGVDVPLGNAEFQSVLQTGGGIPLPTAIRSRMEQAFGYDFEHVRIHTDGGAGQAATAIGAEAFTSGSHVFFAPGQFQPGSEQGARLIAHELTHVVQGDQGQLVGSGVSSPSDATERQAYRNEAQLASGDISWGLTDGLQPGRVAPAAPSVHARIARSADPEAAPTPAGGPTPTPTTPTPTPTPTPAPAPAPAPAAPSAPPSGQPPGSPASSNRAPATAAPTAASPTAATPTSAGPTSAGPTSAGPTSGMPTSGMPTSSPMSAPMSPGGGPVSVSATGDFAAQITAAAATHRSALDARAATARSEVGAALDAERQRVLDGFDQLLQRLQTARDAALQDLQTRSEAAKTRVRDAATAEHGLLDAAVARQQEAARQAGETAAQEAIAASRAEGERVTTGCTDKASRARQIANSWAGRFGALEGGGDMAGDIRSQGESLANAITSSAAEGRQACIDHGNEVAADIRTDAADLVSGMEEKVAEARQRIDTDRDDAITAIDDGLASARDGITQSYEQSRSEIDGKRQEASDGVDQLRQGALEQVDAGLQQMTGQLDEIVAQMTADVEAMVADAAEVAIAPEVSAEVDAGIAQQVSEYLTQLGEFGTQALAGFDGLQTDATAAATQQVDGVLGQLEGVASGYEQNVRGKVDETLAQADASADSAVQDIQRVTPTAEAELQEGVQRAGEEWRGQITEKIGGELRRRVDDVLSQQDAKLTELDGALSRQYTEAQERIAQARREAEERESGGMLDRAWGAVKDVGSAIGGALSTAWEFVKGTAVGIYEAARDMIVGLWQLVQTPLGWLMIILAVVLIALVVILFGWTALIIAGIILGIVLAAYYFYLMVTTPGLSAYERGKLFGRGLFELGMGFVGVEFAGANLLRFTRWGGLIPRAVRVVQQVGNAGRAAELVRLVGGLGRTVELLDKVGDAGRVIELVTRVGDAGRLTSLLDKIGDVGRLTTLLDTVGDAGRLTSLLDKVGDAGRLTTLLDQVGDAGRLSSLLDRVGDADRLTSLLDKLGDANRLTGLLDRVGDADRLTSLLDRVGDADRLTGLLDKVGDADRLTGLLDRVGDADRLTGLLDRVGDADRLTGLLDKVGDADRLTGLLDKVGDAGRLDDLLARAGGADTLDALLAKCPDVDTLVRMLDQADDPQTVLRMLNEGSTPEDVLARLAGIQDDAARVAELERTGALDGSMYHGSNSSILDGLEQTGGNIRSARDLELNGIGGASGEGSLFSGGNGGAKPFISVGVGNPGFGTSLAYADANNLLTHYNPQLYKIADLEAEIGRMRNILNNFDQIPFAPGSPAYVSPQKISERLAQLERELATRNLFPPDHPRYLGGPGNQDNFPILFEFDGSGLTTQIRGLPAGTPLGGEGSVYDAIDLSQRGLRVYVPEANRAEVAARLEQMFGRPIEVLSIEGARAGLATGGDAASTEVATSEALRQLQEHFGGLLKYYDQLAGGAP